jgi:hypothetical protein
LLLLLLLQGTPGGDLAEPLCAPWPGLSLQTTNDCLHHVITLLVTGIAAVIVTAVQGTPGGDLAELVSAIMAWFKLEGKPVNKADIKTLFDAFMDKIAR